MGAYQHRRHNKNLLMVHAILVVKYRRPLLVGEIREDAKRLLFESACRHHWHVKRMETDRDHVHLLLQYNPTDSVSAMVARLEQESTWNLWKAHEELLRRYFWKERTFWSDGCFVASVGNVSAKTVGRHIENQG